MVQGVKGSRIQGFEGGKPLTACGLSMIAFRFLQHPIIIASQLSSIYEPNKRIKPYKLNEHKELNEPETSIYME